VVALAHKAVLQVVVALATAMSAAKDDLLYNAVKAKIIKNNFIFEEKFDSFIKKLKVNLKKVNKILKILILVFLNSCFN